MRDGATRILNDSERYLESGPLNAAKGAKQSGPSGTNMISLPQGGAHDLAKFRVPMIHRFMTSHPVAELLLCFRAKHQDGRPMLFGFHSPRMKRCKPAALRFHGQCLYMWGKVSPNRFSRFQLSKCFYRKNIFIMQNLTDFGKNWWQRGCTYHVSR